MGKTKSRTWLTVIQELQRFLLRDRISQSNLSEFYHALYTQFLLRSCEYTEEKRGGFSECLQIHTYLKEIYQLFQRDPSVSGLDVWGTWMEKEDLHFNTRLGQYMTPQCLCDLMGQLTLPEKIENLNPYRKDPYKVSDPTCGSGRMLLSFAQKWRRVHQRQNFILFGADLDHRMSLITVLNFIYSGCNGFVFHADSLTLRAYEGWAISQIPGLPYSQWEHLSQEHFQELESSGRLSQFFGLEIRR